MAGLKQSKKMSPSELKEKWEKALRRSIKRIDKKRAKTIEALREFYGRYKIAKKIDKNETSISGR